MTESHSPLPSGAGLERSGRSGRVALWLLVVQAGMVLILALPRILSRQQIGATGFGEIWTNLFVLSVLTFLPMSVLVFVLGAVAAGREKHREGRAGAAAIAAAVVLFALGAAAIWIDLQEQTAF
jgi:K+-transporting ATPase A subunit